MKKRGRKREQRCIAEIEVEKPLDAHIQSAARIFSDGSGLYQNDDQDIAIFVEPPPPGNFEIVSEEYNTLPTAHSLAAAQRYIAELISEVLGPGDYEILVRDAKGRCVFSQSGTEEYDEEFHADHFSHVGRWEENDEKEEEEAD